jgi:hypothetical protein
MQRMQNSSRQKGEEIQRCSLYTLRYRVLGRCSAVREAQTSPDQPRLTQTSPDQPRTLQTNPDQSNTRLACTQTS